MTHNNRWRRSLTLLAAGTATLALVGCGNGQQRTSDSNAAKIRSAQHADTNAAAIRSRLRADLGLAHGDFTLSNGGECTVILVTTGASAQAYADDAWTLMSSDGNAAVKVGDYQGTPESACLSTVKNALGW